MLFRAQDVELLQQVATQIAIAVENALAFKQIDKLKDKLAEEKFVLRKKFAVNSILRKSSVTARR